MKIHKEGFRILTVALAIFLIIISLTGVLFSWSVSLITLLVFVPIYIFILRFFRIPNRFFSENKDKVFSPADGTVVTIEEVEETEFLKTRCIQISVFMSVWNVHINWHPIPGKVLYYKYHPGKYLVAWNPKSSTLNERTTIAVEHIDGEITILFRQIAGFLARRIICNAAENEVVSQGQEVGFIKFGSRVDVFIPIDSKVRVKLKDKVIGNQTVLADLPLKSNIL